MKHESLAEPTAIPIYNPENSTSYGLLTIEAYGEKYIAHNTRNFVTNYGLILDLQTRKPKNSYERLMKKEFDKRQAGTVVNEFRENNPKLHATLTAIIEERDRVLKGLSPSTDAL